jgi:uncharacterized protein (DUF1778 family)
MKSASLNIRIDEGDRDILRVAAEASRSSMSDFVRAAALQTADRILADRRRFVVDDAAWIESSARRSVLRILAARRGNG